MSSSTKPTTSKSKAPPASSENSENSSSANEREQDGKNISPQSSSSSTIKKNKNAIATDNILSSHSLTLLSIQNKLTTMLTPEDLTFLSAKIDSNQTQLQLEVSSKIDAINSGVGGKIKSLNNKNLEMVEKWFGNFRDLSLRRQQFIDDSLMDCVKHPELEVFKSLVQEEQEELGNRVEEGMKRLHSSLFTAREAEIKRVLKRSCLLVFKVLKHCVKTKFNVWKKQLSEHKVKLKNEQSKKRALQKIFLLITQKHQLHTLKKWHTHMTYHSHRSQQKDDGCKMLVKALTRTNYFSPTSRLYDKFKLWHRLVISFHEVALRDAEQNKEKENSEMSSTLGEIMRTFHNDTQGGIDVLTREVSYIKDVELNKIRHGILRDKLLMKAELGGEYNNAMEKMRQRTDEFEREMRSVVDAIKYELPGIKDDITSHGESLKEINETVKTLKTSSIKHDKNISAINNSVNHTDSRINTIETTAQVLKNEVSELTEQNTSTNEYLNVITKKLEVSEDSNKKLKKNINDTVTFFEVEIKKLKSLVQNSTDEQDILRLEFINEKEASREKEYKLSTSLATLKKYVFERGIRQPPISLMIRSCLPYEQLSFDRKFCPPINTLTAELGALSLADDISVFAIDYAAFIAYKADQEALSLVISGVNPEEIIYADDEIEVRRRSLLGEVRRDFMQQIEEASPNAGALRLEARAKFCSRLIEAIDSALSKHDQVLISGSSRASKLKGSFPSCVACDRPLRTKGRKGKIMEEEANQHQNQNQGMTRPVSETTLKRPMSSGGYRKDPSEGGYVKGASGHEQSVAQIIAEQNSNGSESPYVLRGGFKMPKSSSRVSLNNSNSTMKNSMSMSVSLNCGYDVSNEGFDVTNRDFGEERVEVKRPQSANNTMRR